MIQLQSPSTRHYGSYVDMMKELRANGDKIWDGYLPNVDETAESFLNRLERAESDPSPGLVGETQFWAIENGQVVGRIALRHELYEALEEFSGHVGYEVRPDCRRRGVAREMLRQVLQTPRAQAIGQILLTCAPDNVASQKTILANGGVLVQTAYVEKWKRQTSYYWIKLAQIP